MNDQIEEKEEIANGKRGLLEYWMKEIELARKREKKWRKRCEHIYALYRGEDSDDAKAASFNVLWANTETLKPAVYSKKPTPDVRRRFQDVDPVAREGAEVLERCLSYSMDAYDFDALMNDLNADNLLIGRALAVVRYIPYYGNVTVREPVSPFKTDSAIDADGNVIASIPVYPEGTQFDGDAPYMEREEEQVVYEEVRCEYIGYDDYVIIGDGKRWENTRAIAIRGYMTRDELVDQFGAEIGGKVNLTFTPPEMDGKKEVDDFYKKAEVWEVWDKKTGKRLFMSSGYTHGPLSEEDDPLGLDGFFPVPKPLYGYRTNNSLVPVPEYALYQEQAQELDIVSKRITALTDMLQVKGIYNAVFKEMSELMRLKDGDLKGIEGIDSGMRLEDVIAWFPIEQIAKVLAGLYEQRDQIKQVIYEVTGIADIVRGATKASETATAQRIKGQFASLRISERRRSMEAFVRDILRIKAEIIAEKFDPETISMIAGREVSPEVVGLIQAQEPRQFRIDVETDSTVYPDAVEEQQQRTEYLSAVTALIERLAPMIQAGVVPFELAKEMLLFGSRAFKGGRELEQRLDEWQPPQPPQPPQQQDPAQEKRLEIEADMMKQDKQLQFDAQQNAADRTLEVARLQQPQQPTMQ